MAEEKKEIEDILAESEKEDIDIEEAVSETEEVKEAVPEIEPAEIKDPEPKEEEQDELEKAVSEPKTEPAEEEGVKEPKKTKNTKTWKIVLLVLAVVLITAALVLGIVYWLNIRSKKADITATNTAQTIEPEVAEPKTVEKAPETGLYVNASDGLRLRKEPNLNAEVLDILPNGTKISPLETSGDWLKVEYNGKTGWVNKEYTSSKNPLVYENTDYGFSLTFPATWASYRFAKTALTGTTATYYVGLPTADKNWVDPTKTADFGSLFAISVYTTSQWQTVQSEVGPKPSKLGEKGEFVIAWSSGQATPTDLGERFKEIKSIISTFKII